jgi:hypothetical protein
MASKTARSDSTKVARPEQEKRGGYGSGTTPASQLKPPTQGVKPADSNKPAASSKK